jgi:hypothetical protein
MIEQAVATPSTGLPAAPTVQGQSVENFASQLVGDPAAFFNSDMQLATQVPSIDPNTAGTNLNAGNYAMDPGALSTQAAQASTSQMGTMTPQQAQTYEAQQSFDRISQPQNQMTAAQGQVDPRAVVQAEQLDMQGLSTGVNRDGSINYAGEALNTYARQDISTIIDTSTMSGKLLAQTLGEGNYTDSKATVMGQMEILSKEFVDPVTGETKIPTWAAGTARSVSRIAAFKGMSGSAATAVMAQALMEASLPIAQQDAQFFQTVTLQNLSNRQQQVINTANVLSKMELANMDSRMTAAVTNSKNFMEMSLANLSNDQQARVINTQARVQSILEDSKAVNAQRLFTAESQNDMNKFYDNLNASISQFNTAQRNGMEQFNVGQVNSRAEFNASLENSREQFYKEMQYNVDVANAKWRQSVTMAETEMRFQAAATDVKNMVGLSFEQLNQLWDRSDALLDYTWKSSETSKERENNLAIAKLQAEAGLQRSREEASATTSAARSSATGSVVGAVAAAGVTAFAKSATAAKIGTAILAF